MNSIVQLVLFISAASLAKIEDEEISTTEKNKNFGEPKKKILDHEHKYDSDIKNITDSDITNITDSDITNITDSDITNITDSDIKNITEETLLSPRPGSVRKLLFNILKSLVVFAIYYAVSSQLSGSLIDTPYSSIICFIGRVLVIPLLTLISLFFFLIPAYDTYNDIFRDSGHSHDH